VPEHEQVLERIDKFTSTGQQVQAFVHGFYSTTRNWRIFPEPFSYGKGSQLRTFMSDDTWNMIQDWEANGI
jgi:hypothetical protein